MERLLITTYNQVILWDEGPHTIWEGVSHPKYHNFYGITWDTKNIYVAEGGHAPHSTIHVFDSHLKRTGKLPIGGTIGDPHQIYWWDGTLYITSTNQDKIALWDGKDCRMVTWRESEPTLHLNSVWCDGENFYVVEHRKREMPKRIRILDLDFEPMGCIELLREAFVKERPHGIHNVYIEGGILYTCSPKAFVRHDLLSGRSEPIVPHRLMNDAHYVRGLARVPGKFFIGLSEAKVRSARGEGDSAVLVTDDDFNVLDILPLENTGGLNEIRSIDGPDLAHNRVRCPYE